MHKRQSEKVIDLLHPELIQRGFWWHAAIEQGSLLYILGVNPLKLLLQLFVVFPPAISQAYRLSEMLHFSTYLRILYVLCYVLWRTHNTLKRGECNTCKRSKRLKKHCGTRDPTRNSKKKTAGVSFLGAADGRNCTLALPRHSQGHTRSQLCASSV